MSKESSTQVNYEHGAKQKNTVKSIGWYFVKEFYTVLSKDASQVQYFYGKAAQSIAGEEGKGVSVNKGNKEIGEAYKKRKETDFKNVQFKITTVDSVEVEEGKIVVSVIGNMKNEDKKVEGGVQHRKYTQTFLLVRQGGGEEVRYEIQMDILRYIGGKGEEIEMNVSDWKEENKVEKQLGTVEAKTKAEKDVKPETKESAKGGATVSMPTPMSAPISMPIPAPAPVQTQAPVQMPLSVAPTASISMPVPTSVSAAPTAPTALKDDKTKTHSRTSSAAKEAKSQPHKKDDQENVLATKNDERSSADVPVGNSWASLAAKNQDKWGNQKANVEAAVSHVPSVTSTPTPPQTSAPSGGRSGGKGPGARRKETNPVFVKSVPSSEIKAVRAAFVAKFGDVLNCEMIGSSSAVFEFQTVEAKRKALEKKELEISPSLTVHIEDRKARFGLSSSGANPSSGASGPSGGGDGRIKHNSSNRSLNVDYDKDKQSLSASSSTSGYNRSSRNSSSNALGYNSSTNPMNRSRKQ